MALTGGVIKDQKQQGTIQQIRASVTGTYGSNKEAVHAVCWGAAMVAALRLAANYMQSR